MLGQRVFHHRLKVDVQREGHVPAGHRLQRLPRLLVHRPRLGDDLSAVAGGVFPDAAFAPEVAFKGPLRPGLAHVGVHVVAQLLVVGPAVRVDGAHLPQHVGGVGGVVLPGGHGVHAHAGKAPLLHLGDEGDVHVLGEHIVGVDHVLPPEIQLVQHAQQGPHVLRQLHLRPLALGGKAEGLAHLGHELLRLPVGDGVVLGLLGQRVVDPLVLHRQRPQIGAALLGDLRLVPRLVLGCLGVQIGVDVGFRKGIGRRSRHREGIRPRHALLPAQGDEPEQDLVALRGRTHDGGVQRHLIAAGVGHQHPAPAVQDLAPDAVHRLRLGGGVGRLLLIAVAVDDLEVVEYGTVKAQHRRERQQQPAAAPEQLAALRLGAVLRRFAAVALEVLIHGRSSRNAGSRTGTGRIPARRTPASRGIPAPPSAAGRAEPPRRPAGAGSG